MALFQPTNIIPSTLSGGGNGTVDVTKPLTVSWQVNGNSPMTAYRIRIMQNDSESTAVLNTGKVTLAAPFYGANAKGEPVPFQTVITAAQMAAAGMTNGYANGYKMLIAQWWSADDSIEQTSASYFITRAVPSIAMQSVPYASSFRQQQYTFEARYSQAQGDMIEWNRWELQAETDGKWVTVDDTGAIFGAELTALTGVYAGQYGIHYTYNGFVIGTNGETPNNGVNYRIKCTVQTVSGVQADTGWYAITTQDINTADPGLLLNLCRMEDTDAVKIEIPKNFALKGTANGTYSFASISTFRYKLELPEGSSVTWGGVGEKSLKISDSPYTVIAQIEITDADANAAFMRADYGDYELALSYDSNGFYVKKNGVALWSTDIQPVTGALVSIAATNQNVYFSMTSGGTAQTENDAISNWQTGEMQKITILGPCNYRYAWVINQNMDQELFDVFSAGTYPPHYLLSPNPETEFLAVFSQTLYTGSGMMDADVKSFAIYRKAKGTPLFKLIANIPVGQRKIMDYSALSTVEYEYFFLNMGEDYYAWSRNAIASITPCFWNYTVLCCSQNNAGDYVVEKEYRFALDVASGNTGNNNSPAFLQNFTPYPLRQPVSANYRSGTLSAYIGKVQNDTYVDSVSLMDELYALSTIGLTKFLKTRKGKIFQIETGAPVAMQIGDKYAMQPAKISLPWVEIGDASNANILGNDGAAEGLPTFTVNPETMEIIMDYSEGSQMGADSFSLHDADLYLNNPGVYDEADYSLNAEKEVILNTD